jgi:hypothetical protein
MAVIATKVPAQKAEIIAALDAFIWSYIVNATRTAATESAMDRFFISKTG